MREKEYTLGGCFLFIAIYCVIAYINSLLLNYDIGFWTQKLQGTYKQIPGFYAFLVSLVPVVGQIAFIVAVVTFILSFIL